MAEKRARVSSRKLVGEREEKFSLSFLIQKKYLTQQQKHYASMFSEQVELANGGEFVGFCFPFYIYYHQLVGEFEAIIALLDIALSDKAEIVSVKTEELLEGRCLAQELFCKLEQIEQKFNGQKEQKNGN